MEDVIPLCLYLNDQSNNSYIGYPAKIHTKKGTKLLCEPKPNSKFVAMFYAINPDISTRPPGMDLICMKESPTSESSTIDIENVYDPFHREKDCVRFYTWIEPTPNTTPLYLWKSGQKIYASFSDKDPKKGFKPVVFSPIHVLVDPRIKGVKRLGNANKNFEIVDDKPRFTFSGYQGRCIPDPNGGTIGDCVVLHGKNILLPNYLHREPTLLNYIDRKYNRREKYTPSLFIGLLIVLVFIVSVFFVLTKLN